tara:strand:+ start:1532 stop:2386 length:855 start_codon:yes stop_codon:yes gene_type:complete
MSRYKRRKRVDNSKKVKTQRQQLVDKIIEMMRTGDFTWRKAFSGNSLPYSKSTGKRYRGFNAFYLAFMALEKGYKSSLWGTFHAWQEAGGNLAGQRAERIYLAKPRLDEDENIIGMNFRCFNVFNRDQVDGLEEEEDKNKLTLSGSLFGYFEKEGISIKNALKASYAPGSDTVTLPERWQKEDLGWSTIAHEAIHSTGHQDRLARTGVTNLASFGSHAYSQEELIAELGAVFICSALSLSSEKAEQNSAAYLSSWIKVLKENPAWLSSAATEASKATDYILDRI